MCNTSTSISWKIDRRLHQVHAMIMLRHFHIDRFHTFFSWGTVRVTVWKEHQTGKSADCCAIAISMFDVRPVFNTSNVFESQRVTICQNICEQIFNLETYTSMLKQVMMYLMDHIVKLTFWHVAGVTMGLHHSSALLALPFKASKSVQHTDISVRHHIPV